MDVLCLVEPAYFPGSTSDIWPILGGERYRSMHNVIRGTTTPHITSRMLPYLSPPRISQTQRRNLENRLVLLDTGRSFKCAQSYLLRAADEIDSAILLSVIISIPFHSF